MASGQSYIGNLLLKRAAPILAGSFYLNYASWETRRLLYGANADEEGNAPGPVANFRANMGMAGAFISEHTGINAIQKAITEYVPGMDNWLHPRSPEEYKEYLRSGYDPVRRGSGGLLDEEFRLRLLGREPMYGSKIKFWQPNWYARAAADADFSGSNLTRDEYYQNSWLPTPRHPFAPLHRLTHPYNWENLHADDRPYPVSGDMFATENPLLAPVAAVGNMTVGQILKPKRINMQVYDELSRQNEEIHQHVILQMLLDTRLQERALHHFFQVQYHK
jgi:hypothetical protein